MDSNLDKSSSIYLYLPFSDDRRNVKLQKKGMFGFKFGLIEDKATEIYLVVMISDIPSLLK